MEKEKFAIIIIMLLLININIVSCTNITSINTPLKAIEEYNKIEVNDIINNIQLNNELYACLYSQKINGELVYNIAFLENKENSEWILLKDAGWSNYSEKELEVYLDIYDDKSSKKKYIAFYGPINNLNIDTVYLGVNDNSFKEVEILNTQENRIHYSIITVDVEGSLDVFTHKAYAEDELVYEISNKVNN